MCILIHMEKEFIHYFDKHSDEVFSMCYEQSYDRGKAVQATQEVFMKTWENVSRGKVSMITSAEHYGKISKEDAQPRRRQRSVIVNQYGY